jgi:hypothetical protein
VPFNLCKVRRLGTKNGYVGAHVQWFNCSTDGSDGNCCFFTDPYHLDALCYRKPLGTLPFAAACDMHAEVDVKKWKRPKGFDKNMNNDLNSGNGLGTLITLCNLNLYSFHTSVLVMYTRYRPLPDKGQGHPEGKAHGTPLPSSLCGA